LRGKDFSERFLGGNAMRSFVLALLIVTSAPSAFAAELPKEGSYDYTACWSGVNNVITFSKTHTASSYEMTGSNRSNPPGGMFDKTTFRCVGMNASLDGKNTSEHCGAAIRSQVSAVQRSSRRSRLGEAQLKNPDVN
jgi:hypothetical protein